MSNDIKQGTLANIGGNLLEKTVQEIFVSKGFRLLKYGDWKDSLAVYGDELLLTNVPYTSIYGHRGTTEFLAMSAKNGFSMRIECKWQQSAGSVDEKLPYLYLNAVESMPEDWIVIIIDGGGFKEGAVEWLKNCAAEQRYSGNKAKKIQVFSLAEFMAWANRLLR
ncbi:MAG TPA: PD-(D/E)XK nuclease superfamily protein [Dissulfurispiraceae bacterium]|nr:PD-(D/E)XK nuclease superfamily protein [Dissulfurispiraceae bacterium]